MLDEWHRQKVENNKKRSLRKKDTSLAAPPGLAGISYFDEDFYGERP